jgi:hypothetical protein
MVTTVLSALARGASSGRPKRFNARRIGNDRELNQTAWALAGSAQILWAAAVPGVLFLGALGAFIKTYRDWRARRTWPIWRGAGWFLLTLTLLCFAFPAMAVQGMK